MRINIKSISGAGTIYTGIAIVFFAAAFISRLAMAALTHHPGHADPVSYLTVAQNLASGKGFMIDYVWNYLTPPDSISHICNDYWMPLVSMIISIPIFLFGNSLFAALIPSIFSGMALAIVTYSLAMLYSNSRMTALFSAIIVVFIPELFADSLVTDTHVFYALFASASMLFMAKGWKEPKFFIHAALFAGLSHLIRQDGILLFLTLLLMISISPAKFADKARTLRSAAFIYLLVLLPVLIGNYITIGKPLPPGPMKTMFLTNYEDLFSYGTDISLKSYIKQGLKNIILLKCSVFILYFRFILREFSIIILALSSIGFINAILSKKILRARGLYLPHLIFCAALLAFYTLAATLIGEHGGFIKSAVAIMPFLTVISVDTIRRRLISEKAFFAVCSFLALFFFYQAMAAASHSIIYRTAQGFSMEMIKHALKEEERKKPSEEIIVMTRYPWQVYYYTGYKAVQVPNNDLDTIYEVAKRYRANYLILPIPERPALGDIYRGSMTSPRFTFLKTVPVIKKIKIFKINLST